MKNIGMIDISGKRKTCRIAKAVAFVRTGKDILQKIRYNSVPKGNVLECARIGGILAAKKTPDLIPLCHNIEIEQVNVDFVFKNEGILIKSRVRAYAKTGVEMEALFSVTMAALVIYDMCKIFRKSIEITDICLVEKSGGKSGKFTRE